MTGRVGKLVSISLVAGGKSIFHQGCDGHRADAAGYGGDVAAFGGYLGEVDITFESESAFFGGVGDAGDADIDDDSAGFDHRGIDKFGSAESGDDDIPLKTDVPEIAGLRVASGDGAVAGLGVGAEQDAHRPADNIAAADYHGVQP